MVKEPERADLVLELSVAPSMIIGYATVFASQVRRVVKGRCTTTEFDLTVLGVDADVEQTLMARRAPEVIEAGFRRHRTGERNPRIPITGFVDDDRTSWKLVYLR
jgi:hypothetical protein